MQTIPANVLLKGLADLADTTPIHLVTTDSRHVEKDSVFVAFPGEKFDGHSFAAKALEQGAAYVVVNHPVEGVDPVRQILCENSYRAMLVMGANYRATLHPVVIGVTGSVGKTTTKQFCHAVFSAFGETVRTEGNQNNELGVPNTLFRMDETTQYGVVEMGMNHAGEISRLTACAKPDAAIITCVGTAHIENLGSRENICKAKLEICESLPDGAPLVLNGDDDMLRAAQLPERLQPVWFSLEDETADVFASNLNGDEKGTFFIINDADYGCFPVHIPAMGRHNVANALAAYCAATRLGLDARKAAKALEKFVQTGMRQKVVRYHGITVIEDCYNANPDSMRAALEMFREFPTARRFAVLGDMLELGETSESAHEEVGRLAAEANLAYLIAYGPASRRMAVIAAAKGLKTMYADDPEEAAEMLLSRLEPGDTILFKASRGMHLEEIIELIYNGWQS